MQEAHEFACCVRDIDKQLERVEVGIQGLGNNVRRLLESPAPSIYKISETGEVVPEVQEPRPMVGSGVQIGRIASSSQVLVGRLREEVHDPLKAWLGAFDRAKVLLRDTEKKRIELDSRKRTVQNLEARANTARQGANEGRANSNQKFEAAEKKLRHKEAKYGGCLEEFTQLEHDCNIAFKTLLADTVHLPGCLSQVYRVLHETSSEAYSGFPSSINPHNYTPTPPLDLAHQNPDPAQYPGNAMY